MIIRFALKCALVLLILATALKMSEGARRCFSCRSRGKLGDCRDTFPYNATYLVKDVEAVPCASGWCSKIIEGDKYGEDHDLATERSCLQRIPPDSTQRCAEVEWNKRKVFACFCEGDLCNSAPVPPLPALLLLLPIAGTLLLCW
ncbi:uncharacterized protein LOC108672519 [Hyalella azteca]|uniref:Uncharacterized protein LOC108672519 n=1 Tax=Hyalella azteca TaxID=294128 RepID=A0A8B7NPT1_HYAAZ|nr:uncharacterized protein LOC108672519 [Hyalella azteca]